MSRTHGAEIEAAPVPGLAWPGSWLSSSSIRRRRNFAAGGFLGLLGLWSCWSCWSCWSLLANGCACAERVRSEFEVLGEPGGEWKRPKAANYRQ
jgi:hypothetical protein